jgi:effector-binding domain-containing protein
MAYECSIRQVAAQPAMSVRGAATVADLSRTIGEFLTEVWSHVQNHGGMLAGPPFTRYHMVDGERLDLEAGLPVAAPIPTGGRVRPSELPGGEVAVTTHVGPYDGLVIAGAALATWTAAQHREAAGPNWEVYVTDPGAEPDPARWRTDIFKPLAPKAG